MESTVRYLGIAIDDALAIAEQLQGSAALTRRTDAAQASFFDGVGNDTIFLRFDDEIVDDGKCRCVAFWNGNRHAHNAERRD